MCEEPLRISKTKYKNLNYPYEMLYIYSNN